MTKYLYPNYSNQYFETTKKYFEVETQKQNFFNLVWACEEVWSSLTATDYDLPRSNFVRKFADDILPLTNSKFATALFEAYSPNHHPKDHPIVIAFGVSCFDFLANKNDDGLWNNLISKVGHNFLAGFSILICGKGTLKNAPNYPGNLTLAISSLIEQFKTEPISVLELDDERQGYLFTQSEVNLTDKKYSDCFETKWWTEIGMPKANFSLLLNLLREHDFKQYMDTLDKFEHESVSNHFVDTRNITLKSFSKHIRDAPHAVDSNQWTESFVLSSTALALRGAIVERSNNYRNASEEDRPDIKSGIDGLVENAIAAYANRDDFDFFGFHFLTKLVKNYSTKCGPFPKSTIKMEDSLLFPDMMLIQVLAKELDIKLKDINRLLNHISDKNKVYAVIAACMINSTFDPEKSVAEIIASENTGIFLLMSNSKCSLKEGSNPHHSFVSGNWGVQYIASNMLESNNHFGNWKALWKGMSSELANTSRNAIDRNQKDTRSKLTFIIDLGISILCCSKNEDQGFDDFYDSFKQAIFDCYLLYSRQQNLTPLISQALANLAYKQRKNAPELKVLLKPYKRQTMFFNFWLQQSITTGHGKKCNVIDIAKSAFPNLETEMKNLHQIAPNIFPNCVIESD